MTQIHSTVGVRKVYSETASKIYVNHVTIVATLATDLLQKIVPAVRGTMNLAEPLQTPVSV